MSEENEHDDLRQLDHHESWEGVCHILEAEEGMDHA